MFKIKGDNRSVAPVSVWLEKRRDGGLDVMGQTDNHGPIYICSLYHDGTMQRHGHVNGLGVQTDTRDRIRDVSDGESC